MKSSWSYNWVLAGLAAANLSFAIFHLVSSLARGPVVVVLGLLLLLVSALIALIGRPHWNLKDERETGIAARAATFSYRCAVAAAFVITMVLPFSVQGETVPLRWLTQAPMLFVMAQLGLKWAAEAVMLGRPE